MVITDRDIFLLGLIQSYGCLTSRQIAAKAFTGVALTAVLRRLRVLEEAGYIQKIRGLETNERLWALTYKALERYLSGPAKLHYPRAILEHDHLLSSIRLTLETLTPFNHGSRSTLSDRKWLLSME